jgi:hypothetical protein
MKAKKDITHRRKGAWSSVAGGLAIGTLAIGLLLAAGCATTGGHGDYGGRSNSGSCH